MTRILTMIAIALALMLAVLWLAGHSSALNENQAMQLVYFGILASVMGSGILVAQRSASVALRNGAIWLLIILVLVAGYVFKSDAKNIGARIAAALRPGSVSEMQSIDGGMETVISKSSSGHFEADVEVNNVTLDMLVDTGASGIALTWQDAEKLGLKPETLTFDQQATTANGLAKFAMVPLSSVSIGPIRRTGLYAGVSENGKLEQSLLGMNFLGSLTAVTLSGDELRLRD